MPWKCWTRAEVAIYCNDPPIAKHLVSRMDLDARLYEHSKWASFLSPLPHRRLRRLCRPATYGDYSMAKSSETTDSAIISFNLWELSRHPEGIWRNAQFIEASLSNQRDAPVLLRRNSTFEFFHPSTGCLKEPVKKRKSLFKGRFTGGKSFPSSCISSNAWRSTSFSSSFHRARHSIASPPTWYYWYLCLSFFCIYITYKSKLHTNFRCVWRSRYCSDEILCNIM